ncbi:GAF-domain-containing protein [Azoarcus olearius]|uniref:HDOD domain-containing protein n=1 Tax=Azoarcus sp. (strain BH72) TaxID=418699 RepID=UPI0008061292|nr:HDOD domain-containing protein [Azoarcus olearius]ANQ84033.1 GAF-domain-containing protein [Azoarcus olearius]
MANRPDDKSGAQRPQQAREPRGAQEWVVHIREQEMPGFGATVAAVHRVTGDEQASAGRLAQVILQDAALTTKVLKLANSAYYNPTRQPISTISRAIVVLGFNVVVEIAIGIMLVDALLTGGVRQRVVAEMARSFHAAVQARALLQLRKERVGEEVFIAALLARVGEMAFWCFGGATAQRLDGLLGAGNLGPEEAQQAVLGFGLRQLSLGLAREWRLGSLLVEVLEARPRPTVEELAVAHAHRLAATAEKGWDSPAMEAMFESLAVFTGEPVEVLRPLLAASAAEAAQIASFYGASEAGRMIPLPAPAVLDTAAAEPLKEADPLLQLRILREISGRVAAGASVGEVLELVLEGIYRAVGFERVLFALLAPNRQQLVGKAALGRGAEALSQRFVFTLDQAADDLLNAFFRSPRLMRLGPGQHPAGLDAGRLELVAGAAHGCIAPIQVQGRLIGLFYADRPRARTPIDDDSLASMLLFSQQVSLAAARGLPGARQQ